MWVRFDIHNLNYNWIHMHRLANQNIVHCSVMIIHFQISHYQSYCDSIQFLNTARLDNKETAGCKMIMSFFCLLGYCNSEIFKKKKSNHLSISPVTASTSSSGVGAWNVTSLTGENGMLVFRFRPSMKLCTWLEGDMER